jgi:hypothetical protein
MIFKRLGRRVEPEVLVMDLYSELLKRELK